MLFYPNKLSEHDRKKPFGRKILLAIAFRNYENNKNLKPSATMEKFLYFVIKIDISKSVADCQYKNVEACHYKHTSHTQSRSLLLALLVVTLSRMIIYNQLQQYQNSYFYPNRH